MRLDPSLTSRARRKDVDEMVDEVKRISSQTMLPEQYFLVKRLGGWRHLEPSWNMEVGPQLDDPGFTWPRFAARKAAADQRSHQWSQQDVEQVRLFHFSGTRFHPWWYADLSPERTYAELTKHFAHRDPRRLVATAVYEWRVALDELLSESKGWLKEERLPLDNAVQRMRQQAGAFRVWRRQRKRCVFTATGVRLAVGTGATVSRSGGATHAGIEMWYSEESENAVGETSMVFDLYRCNCVRIAPPCRSLIREGG